MRCSSLLPCDSDRSLPPPYSFVRWRPSLMPAHGGMHVAPPVHEAQVGRLACGLWPGLLPHGRSWSHANPARVEAASRPAGRCSRRRGAVTASTSSRAACAFRHCDLDARRTTPHCAVAIEARSMRGSVFSQSWKCNDHRIHLPERGRPCTNTGNTNRVTDVGRNEAPRSGPLPAQRDCAATADIGDATPSTEDSHLIR